MQQENEMMLCGSFAKKAGSFGMLVHNAAAKYYGLNFVYKSFSVDDIGDAIKAMRTLNIRGAGITMPYKVEVMKHLDFISEEAEDIGAVNTVVNNNGALAGYNTDWIAARAMIRRHGNKSKTFQNMIFVLGRGGFAKAVCYAAKLEGYSPCCIVRQEWDWIPKWSNQLVFNCTPRENIKIDYQLNESNTFIDGITSTPTGKAMAVIQAGEQFKLYTGKEFPLHFLKRAGIV